MGFLVKEAAEQSAGLLSRKNRTGQTRPEAPKQ